MKTFVYSLIAVVLFSCSDTSDRSAFTGEVQKNNAAPVGTLSSESIYQLTDTFQT